MERMTVHVNNLILEIAFLNTEIDIKVNNWVKVHFNELEELRLRQDTRRNDFHMSRDGFEDALKAKHFMEKNHNMNICLKVSHLSSMCLNVLLNEGVF